MEPFEKPIMVTRPLFPDLERYYAQLESVWESKWLSNNGPKHKELEAKLKSYIKATNISLFNNGTIALMVAVQSLRLQGEVITTPFTFPATTHVLAWNNITPVFCDIHPERLTIDPQKIESLITAKTTAILATHVYGIPCHVEEIQDIANRHGLKVIYDAAHAFTTEYKGRPIAEYGDISMFSFHPTKLFHTGEGGALVYNDPNLKERIEYLKNFGIKNEEEVILPGINGKMGELQASLGLEVIELVLEEQEKRRKIRKGYIDLLASVKTVVPLLMPSDTTNSYQYFCVRIESSTTPGDRRNKIFDALKVNNVFSRKYFYPLVSEYPCYKGSPTSSSGNLKEATEVSNEVLCLPFYGDLSFEDQKAIVRIIEDAS
ncbi:DegT/DnrJ/EryC1/StrS family aminotransferase [Marinobacter sp. ATCH36]|uniref:DegT/DnrJ/EryC1/StrS family aminotransferase n=1 Tax=Marinobacter sp. ATCH36 TaxID=2945106 RepID=UPI002021B4A8|nr:DegT/DnrJ/EryC1/StrS family aminotransferase [Marinobacter sp. ATCH36]MCL7945141.1 DegT/DnrJ/EryC1/StrS family aminotransferase [Marinobacter sp. ATCH36]